MKFQPPVSFIVLVNGRRMKAFVLEELDHPVETVFRVAFSDGFEDNFMLEADGAVYGSGINAIPYAKSLRMDICHAVGLDPNRFYYIYREMIYGFMTNIWVIEGDCNEQLIYKVYYNEHFRFALQKTDAGWTISHQPAHGKLPDQHIVKQTGFMLDTLLEASC